MIGHWESTLVAPDRHGIRLSVQAGLDLPQVRRASAF
jgi:hypothetical protein